MKNDEESRSTPASNHGTFQTTTFLPENAETLVFFQRRRAVQNSLRPDRLHPHATLCGFKDDPPFNETNFLTCGEWRSSRGERYETCMRLINKNNSLKKKKKNEKNEEEE